MAIFLEENKAMNKRRHELYRLLDKPTSDLDSVAIIKEIHALDEAIQINLDKWFQKLREDKKAAVDMSAPISYRKRYKELIMLGRDARALVKEIADFKKYMRERKK